MAEKKKNVPMTTITIPRTLRDDLRGKALRMSVEEGRPIALHEVIAAFLPGDTAILELGAGK